MHIKDFWYVVAQSDELRSNTVLARKILSEWLAVFRDENGKPVVVQDRCKHRSAQLSLGKVENGCLRCPYHGWLYNGEGEVVEVPSEGENLKRMKSRSVQRYECIERDDYIYVRLQENSDESIEPFAMRHYKESGWHTVRLINRFQNNVTNCVENFIDIPHTVSVHPKIFRSDRRQKIDVSVVRKNGSVKAIYKNETDNLGWFRFFLNPSGEEIVHTDEFFMPNISCVEYVFGPKRHFIITSQSVPVEDDETLVYTDLTYNYGIWNFFAAPIVRWQGQLIIDQDIEILANQMKVIKKYGSHFSNTPSDSIHVFVESIRRELEKGKDPRDLPEKSIEFSMLI